MVTILELRGQLSACLLKRASVWVGEEEGERATKLCFAAGREGSLNPWDSHTFYDIMFFLLIWWAKCSLFVSGAFLYYSCCGLLGLTLSLLFIKIHFLC